MFTRGHEKTMIVGSEVFRNVAKVAPHPIKPPNLDAMNETEVAIEPAQLRDALRRKLGRGLEILDQDNLTAEQLEAWSRSTTQLATRLSDMLGDPIRNQVRRALDGDSVPLEANAIDMLRIQFGYGNRELARLADVSQPSITRTIEGKAHPGPGVAKAIADVWHLGVLELFELDDNSDKLTPRNVGSLLAAMKERDTDLGSAAWIRTNTGHETV